MSVELNILLVDDHPLFRKGLVELLQDHYSGSRIYEASDGEEAVEMLKKEQIDIAVLDMDMPGITGVDVARSIKENNFATIPIILTMHKDVDIYQACMDEGAKAYLIKECSTDEIVTCIETVLKGESYVSQEMSQFLQQSRDYQQRKNQLSDQIKTLTKTELKTLHLVRMGFSSRDIAEQMVVTTKSVENYRSRICKKLNLPSGNNSLIKWVFENNDLLTKILHNQNVI